MATKELSPDTSEEEQEDIIACKYEWKKIFTTKEPNVLTRNRSRALQSLNNNVKVGTNIRSEHSSVLRPVYLLETKKNIPLMKMTELRVQKKTKREISTGTSLSNVVPNPLPILKYLQLKLEKSSSSIKSVERRFSDNILSWDNFISQ
ncbi:2306_t:CDS:2, partial [Cetraspora pellucida]